MGSEINNIAPPGAGLAALRSATATPTHAASSAVQVPETPKVMAPKPVAIQFDPSEVRQNVQDAVRLLNQQMSANNRGLGFHMDESVGGPVVTVRSAETGEVVRQIPNEVVVNIAHSIDHMKGLLFSAKS
jgi:flagellar protein FlaG